jgi:hypothetical protein
MTRSLFAASALLAALAAATPARADLVSVGPGAFGPSAPVVTFDSSPEGTTNPSYSFTSVPGLGNVQVSFGGLFLGQMASGVFPVTLSDSSPDAPLTLATGGPAATVSGDGTAGPGHVLSGTPLFHGVVSAQFSQPVAAFGLMGGWFNTVGSTTLQAYGADGSVLGSLTNTAEGYQFLGLADAAGDAVISGFSVFITGTEPFGFGIDDVTFAGPEGPVTAETPEPSALALLACGAAGALAWRRRRSQLAVG